MAGDCLLVFSTTCLCATGSGRTSPTRIEDLVVRGSLWDQPISLGLGLASCDGALAVKNAKARMQVKGVPLMIVNRFGQGKAILLNFDLGRAPEAMVKQLVEAALAVAGVRPECRLEGPKGSKLSVLRRGDATLVGAMLPDDTRHNVQLTWAAPMHAYNVRTGEYLGKTNAIALSPLPPTPYGTRAQVHLISLHAEPMKQIALTGPSSAAPGGALPLQVAVDLDKASLAGRLLRIEVIAPSGRSLRHLRGFLTLTGGKGNWSVPFAFNDATGMWTVRVTDILTGVRADHAIQLK